MDDLLLAEPDAPAGMAEVVLPIGYRDGTGRVHRRVALRKLRGIDEALFHDTTLNGARLVSALLQSTVLRLGEIASPGAALLSQLYSADRNYLLFELRRITFGDAWLALYRCPTCDSTVRLTEELSSFTVRRLSEEQQAPDVVVDLEDGYRDRAGVPHLHLVLRLPRGDDEEFVSSLAETDLWQARDALIVRCIRQFGTLPRAALEAFGVKILRELTLSDRRQIQRALEETTPGINFRRALRCAKCGAEFDAIADVTDFFEVS